MNPKVVGQLITGIINGIAGDEDKPIELIEEQLADQMHVERPTIRRYKSGNFRNQIEYQRIEILAKAGVSRGRRNREWLLDFLRATNYPFPELFADQLLGSASEQTGYSSVYQNLPAPNIDWVPRPDLFNAVTRSLRRRNALVAIVGFSGVGKTSLALEVAMNSLKSPDHPDGFDAAIWVTDRNRPGTTSLESVLDQIARTLEFPGVITQHMIEQKKHEIEKLLRSRKVLLIIDNFDTIRDTIRNDDLLEWLIDFPAPSKVLLTDRVNRGEFQAGGAAIIKVSGMSQTEGLALMEHRLSQLGLGALFIDEHDRIRIFNAAHGNPKAIMLAIGCLALNQPLDAVLGDVDQGRGEFFDALLARAWAPLNETEQQVLLAMSLFPGSTSQEMLAATLNLYQYQLEPIVIRLTALGLLDLQRTKVNEHGRYALHPLIRGLARGELTQRLELERKLLQRWVNWGVELADKVGFCFADLNRLELLKFDHEALYSLIQRTFENQWYEDTIRLVHGITYFYYVKGWWGRKEECRIMQVDAARALGDKQAEISALSFLINLLSRQERIQEVRHWLPRLEQLVQEIILTGDDIFHFHHARASFYLAQQDVATATYELQTSMQHIAEFTPVVSVDNRQWLASCLRRSGDTEQARALFEEARTDAIAIHFERAKIFITTQVIGMDLDEGILANVEHRLHEIRAQATNYQDYRRLADIERTEAKLHRLEGNYHLARQALRRAIEWYERLGMLRDLREAQAELQHLNP